MTHKTVAGTIYEIQHLRTRGIKIAISHQGELVSHMVLSDPTVISLLRDALRSYDRAHGGGADTPEVPR
jgi:hypothetical protein